MLEERKKELIVLQKLIGPLLILELAPLLSKLQRFSNKNQIFCLPNNTHFSHNNPPPSTHLPKSRSLQAGADG